MFLLSSSKVRQYHDIPGAMHPGDKRTDGGLCFFPFCATTVTLVLDLWWRLPLVLKPVWIPYVLSHLCNSRGQHGSWAFLIHILIDHVSTSIGGCLNLQLFMPQHRIVNYLATPAWSALFWVDYSVLVTSSFVYKIRVVSACGFFLELTNFKPYEIFSRKHGSRKLLSWPIGYLRDGQTFRSALTNTVAKYDHYLSQKFRFPYFRLLFLRFMLGQNFGQTSTKKFFQLSLENISTKKDSDHSIQPLTELSCWQQENYLGRHGQQITSVNKEIKCDRIWPRIEYQIITHCETGAFVITKETCALWS